MNSKKRIISVVCIVLAVLILGLGIGLIVQSCQKKPPKRKVIKKVIVVQDPGTTPTTPTTPTLPNDYGVVDDPESVVDGTYERVRRQLSLKNDYTAPDYVPEYKLTKSAWAGPEGYVIVASKDVRACRDAAKLLQAYFKEATGITVPCVTDDAAPAAKEILVGDTNRRSSNLKSTEFGVKLDGDNLVFEGGHFAMVETAVDWFRSFKYESGNVNLLTGEIKDFLPSVKIDGKTLDYVWGDEHGGNKLNTQKWNFYPAMYGNIDMVYMTEEPYVQVNEGQLKLTAGRYYDMYDISKEYQTNLSVTTKDSMSYIFGYCEFRAKVPYKQGSWPSYWFISRNSLRNRFELDQYPELPKYSAYIEIDFLEALSSKGKNYPNLHKWYRDDSVRAQETGKTHTSWGEYPDTNPLIIPYEFEDVKNVSEQYHVYGMNWTADKMDFTMDGEFYWSFDLTYNFDGIDYDGDADKHFTDQPIFAILNNYIATPRGGNTNDRNIIDPTTLPYEYFVDYSRYYQNIEEVKAGIGELNLAPENY